MHIPYILWKEVEAFAAQFKIDGVSILLDDTAKKFAHAFANAAMTSYAVAKFTLAQQELQAMGATAQEDAKNIPSKKIVL